MSVCVWIEHKLTKKTKNEQEEEGRKAKNDERVNYCTIHLMKTKLNRKKQMWRKKTWDLNNFVFYYIHPYESLNVLKFIVYLRESKPMNIHRKKAIFEEIRRKNPLSSNASHIENAETNNKTRKIILCVCVCEFL